jgi:MFS family permease
MMRTPCETVSRSAPAEVPCNEDVTPWILTATILASSMAFIDNTAVNVALPALQKSLHATVVDVQWVVESYGLFLGALILIGGTLGDMFGRRLVFLMGTTLFAVASMACGVSSSIQILIIARSMQGVGAALLVPGSLAIISTSFDEKSRGRAIGAWSGWTAITTAVGPVLGGWLVEHASWRWVFIINLPLAAAVIGISVWRIPESRSAIASRVDWSGAILATLGLSGLVFGFIESTSSGWRNLVVAGSLIAAFVCLLGFIALETRTASPMIPLALFKNQNFSGANIFTFLLYAAVGIFFFLLPLNLIQVQQYSATAAGAAILPMILLVVTFGFALFAVPSVGADYWKTIFPAMTILGLGMAITVAPLTTDVMNSVDEDHVGTASGINNAVARVAGVLGIAVLGIVMVSVFRARLDHTLDRLSLSSGIVLEIRSQEERLAGLQPPASLDAPTRAAVTDLVRHGFVFGFRIVIMICASLTLASAIVAWFMVPGGGDHSKRAASRSLPLAPG